MAQKRKPAKKPVDKQKQADKRARREERKAAELEAKLAAARKKRIRKILGAVAAILIVGTVGFFIFQKANPGELPGVAQQPNEGRDHLLVGETFAYGTATPTSGRHAARAAACGIFSQPMPLEFAVHALEHGTVVIWYQPTLEPDVIDELETIVNGFDDRVVLSPNLQLTDPVVATAWNRLKAYPSADPELQDFIELYRGRGPESVRCPY